MERAARCADAARGYQGEPKNKTASEGDGETGPDPMTREQGKGQTTQSARRVALGGNELREGYRLDGHDNVLSVMGVHARPATFADLAPQSEKRVAHATLSLRRKGGVQADRRIDGGRRALARASGDGLLFVTRAEGRRP